MSKKKENIRKSKKRNIQGKYTKRKRLERFPHLFIKKNENNTIQAAYHEEKLKAKSDTAGRKITKRLFHTK